MTETIMIENGWGITNNNTDPTSLQFFVRGSSTTTTKVNIKNNTTNSAATPIMIYAPNSDILLENNAIFNGGLVGKTVELKNDVQFTFDPNSLTPTGSTALVYQPMRNASARPSRRARCPTAGVEHVYEAIRAGASGFLLNRPNGARTSDLIAAAPRAAARPPGDPLDAEEQTGSRRQW